jgi:hypothetical protein
MIGITKLNDTFYSVTHGPVDHYKTYRTVLEFFEEEISSPLNTIEIWDENVFSQGKYSLYSTKGLIGSKMQVRGHTDQDQYVTLALTFNNNVNVIIEDHTMHRWEDCKDKNIPKWFNNGHFQETFCFKLLKLMGIRNDGWLQTVAKLKKDVHCVSINPTTIRVYDENQNTLSTLANDGFQLTVKISANYDLAESAALAEEENEYELDFKNQYHKMLEFIRYHSENWKDALKPSVFTENSFELWIKYRFIHPINERIMSEIIFRNAQRVFRKSEFCIIKEGERIRLD